MSFPRYPEYKDSGVEWLGVVPAHWPLLRLKKFTSFSGGGTPSRDNMSFWNGDIPWVSPKDMKAESIEGAEERITQAGLDASASTLLPQGRLLMVVRSGILKHTIPVALNAIPVAMNQDMKALHFAPQQCLSTFFLRWVQGLNDVLLQAWAKQGATVESIEHDYLANSLIPLPPLAEQTTIAAFLDRETAKIDALVAEQEMLIALLKEKRQAVISHAVTKGLNPDAPMKPSGIEWLGDVPAHWRLTPLKYLTAFRSGGTPSKANESFWDGDIPWASAKDMKLEVLDDTEDHITDAAVQSGGADLLPIGSVLVVVRGMILARIFPVTVTSSAIAINQDLKALLPGKTLGPDFLAWYLRGTAAESLTRLDEAGHGTKALRMDAWSSLTVAVPPLKEQLDVVRFIESETKRLDVLNSEAEHAITLLKERRSALISATVTGQIDVRGLVPASAA